MYLVESKKKYDFKSENHSSLFPNFHRYPASMLPQIGIELFKELNIKKGILLDPYCGTGSSFLAGLVSGINSFHGFDINPLAILIAKARYTKINKKKFSEYKKNVIESIHQGFDFLENPCVTNINFWFSNRSIKDLNTIKYAILTEIIDLKYQHIFWTAFSKTVRTASYTRKSEFKLYRIKKEKISEFKPNVFEIFLSSLEKIEGNYFNNYLPLLKDRKFSLKTKSFCKKERRYNVVLTSPPYGDSRTTVAYGQYSTFTNEWMGIKNARKIDNNLMGGYISDSLYQEGILKKPISKISKIDMKRGLQVSAFYIDLKESIANVASSIQSKGYAIYIVGNRTVKNIVLPTDQFIAEQFEACNLKHLFTYKRKISSKVMPAKNSPTNVPGAKVKTMHEEYIVVCKK